SQDGRETQNEIPTLIPGGEPKILGSFLVRPFDQPAWLTRGEIGSLLGVYILFVQALRCVIDETLVRVKACQREGSEVIDREGETIGLECRRRRKAEPWVADAKFCEEAFAQEREQFRRQANVGGGHLPQSVARHQNLDNIGAQGGNQLFDDLLVD